MTGQTKMVVTDEGALTRWVADFRPSKLVVAVNPLYLDELRERAKSQGLGPVTDALGSVIPGVEIVEVTDAD